MWNDVIISRDLPANVIKPLDLPVLINNNTCYHLSSVQSYSYQKGLNKDDDVAKLGPNVNSIV